MKVGFIGLGLMGSGISANLRKAGHAMVVHDARRAAADGIIAAGADWAASPKQVAEATEIVFTSLPGPPEFEAVATGTDGLLSGLQRGQPVFDFSTNSPTLIRRLAPLFEARGAHLVPVRGELVPYVRLREWFAEKGARDVGGAVSRQLSGLAFQHLAQFQKIAMQQRMALDQVLPGVGKMGFEPVRDRGAAAVARAQQALGNELLYRLAQRGPRHAEFQRQRALRRQLVRGLERALQDAFFDFSGDRVGQAHHGGLGWTHGHQKW